MNRSNQRRRGRDVGYPRSNLSTQYVIRAAWCLVVVNSQHQGGVGGEPRLPGPRVACVVAKPEQLLSTTAVRSICMYVPEYC